MDAIDNPLKRFIFHYNYAPYAVVDHNFIIEALKTFGLNDRGFGIAKSSIKRLLNEYTEKLNSIIPGYKSMSFEKKVDFVNNKLQIMFEQFFQMLKRSGIHNVEFKKLSDIDRNYTLKISKTFTCDSSIDLAKNFLMYYYTQIYGGLVISSDLDRSGDDKTIYNLKEMSLPIKFTVCNKESGWGINEDQEYTLSHQLIIAQGKQASEIFKTALMLSKVVVNVQAEQYFQISYDSQILEATSDPIMTLIYSILYNGDYNKAFKEMANNGLSIDIKKWEGYCQTNGILPETQLGGRTWNPGDNPRDKELLIKYDLEDFIIGYKEVENYLKSNKIYLSPSQCSNICLKTIEVLKSKQNSKNK